MTDNTTDDDIGLLSFETQELLGKKISWIVRNGNLMLLFAVLTFFFMCFIIEYPTYQIIQSMAFRNQNHYETSFKIPVSKAQYLSKNDSIIIQTKDKNQESFSAKIISITKTDDNLTEIKAHFQPYNIPDLPKTFAIEINTVIEKKRLIYFFARKPH